MGGPSAYTEGLRALREMRAREGERGGARQDRMIKRLRVRMDSDGRITGIAPRARGPQEPPNEALWSAILNDPRARG
jgi:hypothetical protein